jgi:hypothetical protein
MSDVHDARLPAVRNAVEYWNVTLSGLGSSFRLGSIAHVPELVPYEHVLLYARRGHEFEIALGNLGAGTSEFPKRIRKISDDIIVVLTTNKGHSFATYDPPSGKVLAVIGGSHFNVWKDIVNVVAHELGHVVGLGHNSEAGGLMCGVVGYLPRCRVGGEFISSDILPLTMSDQRQLLEMYPPHWPEQGPPRPWRDDPPVIPNVRFGGGLRSGS